MDCGAGCWQRVHRSNPASALLDLVAGKKRVDFCWLGEVGKRKMGEGALACLAGGIW